MVIAARDTMSGLTAAHTLVRQYVCGYVPPAVQLLGVVVTADRPGRLDGALRRRRASVAALAENLWTVDYHTHTALHLTEDLPTWGLRTPPPEGRRVDPRIHVPPDATACARALADLITARLSRSTDEGERP